MNARSILVMVSKSFSDFLGMIKGWGERCSAALHILYGLLGHNLYAFCSLLGIHIAKKSNLLNTLQLNRTTQECVWLIYLCIYIHIYTCAYT